MKIKNIDGFTMDELHREVSNGGRFVLYSYTISIILMTFKRPSSIYFVKGDQNRTVKGLPFTVTTLLLGWWGFPWGPIYTIGSLATNLGGGKDVTDEIMQNLVVSSIGSEEAQLN
jgi:hypothetical protein